MIRSFLSLFCCVAVFSWADVQRPVLRAAAIIEMYDDQGEFQGIVLIERGKAPFGAAMPGGKVEYGETVEEAVAREMMEEVHLQLADLRQFHVYSNPARDFRHHSVEVTFIARGVGTLEAGDDAAIAWISPIGEIPWERMAFDHADILRDYLIRFRPNCCPDTP